MSQDSRRGWRWGAAGLVCIAVALVAVVRLGGVSRSDSMLQTSRFSLGQQSLLEAAQQGAPVVAQAVTQAVPMQQAPAMVAQAMPVQQQAAPTVAQAMPAQAPMVAQALPMQQVQQAVPMAAQALPVQQVSAAIAQAVPMQQQAQQAQQPVAQAFPVQAIAAQAIPAQQQQQQQMVRSVPAVAQAVSQIIQRLDGNPPMGAPAAGAPVTANPAEAAAAVSSMVAQFSADAAGQSGSVPIAVPPQPDVPYHPVCPVGKTPCAAADCLSVGGGCWVQDNLAATGWSCQCFDPPPPPVIGSVKWLQQADNQVQGPSEGQIANSAMLGVYESGKIAVQLDRYLKGQADRLQSQAAIGNLILDQLKAAQPCKLIDGGPGGMWCEDTTADATGSETKKGLLGLGVLGLHQTHASSSSSLAETSSSATQSGTAGGRPLTKEESAKLAQNIQQIMENDHMLPQRDRNELAELDDIARRYDGAASPSTGAAALSMSSPLLSLLIAMLVAFKVHN